jgi:hypothetical protein
VEVEGMDDNFKEFLSTASGSKLEIMINQLELEGDNELDDFINSLSALVF